MYMLSSCDQLMCGFYFRVFATVVKGSGVFFSPKRSNDIEEGYVSKVCKIDFSLLNVILGFEIWLLNVKSPQVTLFLFCSAYRGC